MSKLFLFPSLSLAFLLEMARTKTTANPPPPINYKSLYRWAPDSLLAETSKITSIEDIAAYKESETSHKTRIFRKEHDRFVKVLPCRKSKLVSIDESPTQKVPSSSYTPPSSIVSSFAYHSRALNAHFLPRSTWPLPSYIPTTGHSLGPSLYSTTTLAIRHQWMSSCTSSKPRTQGRNCG